MVFYWRILSYILIYAFLCVLVLAFLICGCTLSSTLVAWSMFKVKMSSPFYSAKIQISACLSLSRKTLCTSLSDRSTEKHKVVVISGPTGAGKSRLAIEIAKRLNGEVISADSVQIYRGLDVGSAKPSLLEREEVTHHLVDILDPTEDYSAGRFFEDAREVTRKVLQKGRVPVVAGGTGLYLRWYIYGKPDVPKSSSEITSKVWAELGDLQMKGQWDDAVEMVVKAGHPKAREFPTNNWYRLRRSLEIIQSSGSPPSAFHVPYDSFREQSDVTLQPGVTDAFSTKDLDYDFICIFLTSPRIGLYRSIDLRCEEMLMDTPGLLSEAQWLLDIGLQPNMNSATRAIGYRQAMEYLLEYRQRGGRSSPEDFRQFLFGFQKVSRNFAKRQLTWFRNERIYRWVNASQPFDKVVQFITDSYHNRNQNELLVPDSLQIERESKSRKASYELKSYHSENKLFVSDDDFGRVLEWINRSQLQYS